MKDKVKALKDLEYQVKLMQFRLKYSKSVWETIGLTMQLGMTINNFRIVQSQPLPRFPSGGLAIVGHGDRPEVIQRKDGTIIK